MVRRPTLTLILDILELYPCSAQWGCSQVSRALYLLYRSTVQSLVIAFSLECTAAWGRGSALSGFGSHVPPSTKNTEVSR